MASNVSDAPASELRERADPAAAYGVARSKQLRNSVQAACDPDHKIRIVWKRVFVMGLLQLAGLYGLYLVFTSAKLATTAFAFILSEAAGLGITAGAHRLWAHRAYQATVPLRVLLALLHTIAVTFSVINWARVHRSHHKYSETDADPHNSNRGMFFSHVGWLLCEKHPDVLRKGKSIDVSDLEQDPILAFQKKHFLILVVTFGFILPILIPIYLWNESFLNAWLVVGALRCTYVWNVESLVNSVAHAWGNRPYERSIAARESLAVSVLALGEGWHNYHHAFPWDYKAAELGNYRANLTTAFIDLMARIGWAYDLKTAPPAMVQARVQRTGDGSHEVWGWGDRDMADEDYKMATIKNKRN